MINLNMGVEVRLHSVHEWNDAVDVARRIMTLHAPTYDNAREYEHARDVLAALVLHTLVAGNGKSLTELRDLLLCDADAPATILLHLLHRGIMERQWDDGEQATRRCLHQTVQAILACSEDEQNVTLENIRAHIMICDYPIFAKNVVWSEEPLRDAALADRR